MTKNQLLLVLLISAALLIILDFIGHWLLHSHSHSFFFIGEQAAFGFAITIILFLLARIIGFFIRRNSDYYDELRDTPSVIEIPPDDWIEKNDR